MLGNVTIEEFRLTELAYEQYIATNNIKYIEALAGILFRPARFWGIDDDIRVKLTTHGYIKRASRFRKLNSGVKYAIYLNYEGCRNCIHDKYKEVFTPGSNSGKTSKPQPSPWDKIIESASNDIFGSYESTRETNLHTFLSRLGTRIKEAREADERMKK